METTFKKYTVLSGQTRDLKMDLQEQLFSHIRTFKGFSFSVTPIVLWEAQRVWWTNHDLTPAQHAPSWVT